MSITIDLGHALLAAATIAAVTIVAYLLGHTRGAEAQWRADRDQVDACRSTHPAGRDAVVIPFRQPSPN